ncbi:MAG: hypothetical protein AAB547_03585 [Patescibacteria group bacterium]
MSWILVALGGYFFNAVAALLDKYILSGPIKAPAVYAFFVSLFSLFALFFIPFGFQFFGWRTTGIFLLSGLLFLYGLVAFYAAVQWHEISRIAPLVGTVISLVAFGTVFAPALFSEGTFTLLHVLALLLLISGGLLISFDLPLRAGERIPVFVIIAGIAMGVSLLLLKYGYADANFVSGLVWSRIGMFAGGLSLLLVPVFREQILSGSHRFSTPSRAAVHAGSVFIVGKVCGGVATFLIAYAAFLGPVSFVQALSGMQYVFLLVLALPLSFRYPQVFGERLFFWDWFQKACAIVLIGLGLWLAAMGGIKLLL